MDSNLLHRAARAWIAMDEAGLRLDLLDRLDYVAKEFNGDRQAVCDRHYRDRNGYWQLVAGDFAKATGANIDEAAAAMKVTYGDDIASILCQEIVDFANEHARKRGAA